ncbi:MAG: hypothetical protein KF690_02315 [Bacteroidetes bacterium]|nr:hypothetical protein [Bacteroidota bacterium]
MRNLYLQLLVMTSLLLAGCATPEGKQLSGSAGTLDSPSEASDVLKKMALYKHLSLDADHVHARRAGGRFLRLEHPDADGWVDMLTLQKKDGTPVVVYLQSICEPDCEQQLRAYGYVKGRFVDETESLVPADLKASLLTGKSRMQEDRVGLGYVLDVQTGNVELYIYKVNDAKVYEQMQVRGEAVGMLAWDGTEFIRRD